MKSIFVSNKLEWPLSPGSSNQAKRPGAVIVPGFGTFQILVDWGRGEICHRGGRRCKLSVRETELLACLARKAGTPVSRDEILSQVWKLDPRRTTTRTIDMHISLLRKKLVGDAEGACILITVHRVGYMLHRGAISSDAASTREEGHQGWWEATRGNKTFSVV